MKHNFSNNILPAFIVYLSLFLATKLNGHGYGYIYFIGSFFLLSSLLIFFLFTHYKTKLSIPKNTYLLFFLGFLFWASLSYIWSPASSNTLKSLLILYLFPLAVLASFWSTLKQQSYFYNCLIFLLIIISIKAGYQSFFLNPKLPAPGFFSNKNTNASFIAMILLPICAQFLNTKIHKNTQTLYGVVLFTGAFILSLTLSRGAVLGLSIGLLLLFIHTRLNKHSITPFIKLISYLGIGYVSAILMNKGGEVGALTQKTLNTNFNTLSSGRGSLWEAGWQMYLDQPLLGQGFNMFYLLFPQYRLSPDAGQYVHNDYFQFLIELGPLGLLLFIAFVITFFVSAKKLYRYSKDQNDKLFYLGLTAACISVLTHSFFTFNLYQPAPLLLLGLYIGILTQKLNQLSTENIYSIQLNNVITPFGYFSLLSIISLVFIYFTGINYISSKKAFSHYKNNLIALEEAETAHQLNGYDSTILAKQLYLYVDLLYNEENKINEKGRTYLIDRGIKITAEAIKKNPFVHANYINTAKLYLLSNNEKHPDRINIIKSAFRQSIIINPFDLKSRLDYIKILMQLNEKQEAIQVFTGALNRTYFGTYKDAVYYLQLFLALMSDSGNKTAINSLKKQIDQLSLQTKKNGLYRLYSW